MKKILTYIFLSLFLLSSCTTEQTATKDDLKISGITGNEVVFKGEERATFSFSIEASYPWQILPNENFVCEPSYGEAGTHKVVMTVLQSNNTLHKKELGGLNFKMLSTKFIGITVSQNPQISISKQYDPLKSGASKGSTTTFKFQSEHEVFIEGSSNVSCKINSVTQKGYYDATVSVLCDNLSVEEKKAGEVIFYVNGVKLEEQLDVIQQASIIADRSRVLLSGQKNSRNSLFIETPFHITFSVQGNNFMVEKTGEKTFEIKALSDNISSSDTLLGYVIISLEESSSSSISVPVYQRPYSTSKTLMFYFLGTALSSYYTLNIDAIAKAVEDVQLTSSRILVFQQSSTNKGATYEFRFDQFENRCVREKIKEYSLPSPYTSEMMGEILRDMTAFAQANNYGLMIGSHGLGWIPKGDSKTISSTSSFRPKRPLKMPGALTTRDIGDSSGTDLDTDDIRRAIASTDVHLDYLLMDACFMSSIEFVYDMRTVTDHIIASPTEVMGSGFPYQEIVPILLQKDIDYDAVCRTYVDKYQTASTKSACVAHIVTSQLENLAVAVKKVNASKQKSYNKDHIQSFEGTSASHPFHIFYDLEDYVEQSCDDVSMVDAFHLALQNAVLSRYHTEKFYSAYNSLMNSINHYSGISTSAPCTEWAQEWKNTNWYKVTH
ncbi:MAG: hypothetical protein KBS95_01570 [Alistipes sp.]|nr:hypothetical protein [Candidatus Alistipes equi]